MRNGLAIGALPLLWLAALQAIAATVDCPTQSSRAQSWLDASLPPECRADALIKQLPTLDDKLAALGGGLKRFGVADARASDGPAGPTHVPSVASLPDGMTVAATFDVELGHAYGAAVGGEFRAAGILQMLGPTVDIARSWHSGRVW
jgi:beta-glucosidase